MFFTEQLVETFHPNQDDTKTIPEEAQNETLKEIIPITQKEVVKEIKNINRKNALDFVLITGKILRQFDRKM